MVENFNIEKLLARACDSRVIAHGTHATLESELRELRHKAAAWDFLLAYDDPDPVPGATLGEYMDAAQTYATDYAQK